MYYLIINIVKYTIICVIILLYSGEIMKNAHLATEVFAWGEKIATLLEDQGKIYFEAVDNSTLQFSPIQLSNVKTQSFSDLAHQSYLPGLISDHLPGGYGLKYMDAFFQKEFSRLPSTLERLQFIGQHSIGALEFQPASSSDVNGEIIELQEMVQLSKDALKGEHAFDLATLIAISNSAGGGARAKAHIGFNQENQNIYVANKHAELPKGFRHSIVKFDEYFESGHAYIPTLYSSHSVYTKTEYIYSVIAKKLGITMADTFLIQTTSGAHFMTHRFDQIDGERQHLHSLSGLLHHDASKQFSLGYEQVFRTALALNVPQNALEQIYKTMIFNLVFGNRDDHSKNFSFIMSPKKVWDFSPSYDLTYVINRGAGSEHQLSINNQPASWATFKEIELIAKTFSIKNYKEIIENTIEAKKTLLGSYASAYEIPIAWINEILTNTSSIDKNLAQGSNL